MNPQAVTRFKQLRELFDLVIELPAHEQESALRRASNDEVIITQVLNMLKADATTQTHISSAIVSMFSDAAATELDVGATLGNWRLAKLIGSGGMGGVFLAERSDGHFSQNAAVKILRGIPSPAAATLIAQERQVLASLEHPNIARLLDGGATPAGRPYLVMEYVEGVALDAYAKALSIKELLNLFLAICASVAFAHRRLVVHCDLKPSNILVNNEGQVKLLDFGVSRLISTDSTDSTAVDGAAAVEVSNFAFTPRYASPEQKSGGAISTSTDIYSLGKILGELLAALKHSPKFSFDLLAGSTLPAELLAIVQCAKATKQAERYATVDDFAADIRRYLARESVRAHPQTFLYLSSSLVRRRWPWLLGATVVVATLSVSAWRVLLERDSAVDANYVAEREREKAVLARNTAESALADAARERDRAKSAEAAATQASALAEAGRVRATAAEARAVTARDAATSAVASSKKVNQFLVSVFSGVDPAKGGNREATAREVVALAEKKLDDLNDVSARDRADLFLALLGVHTSLGANAAADRYSVRAVAALAEVGDSADGERAAVLSDLTRIRVRRGEGDALAPATEQLRISEAKFGANSVQVGRALMAQADAFRAVNRLTEQQANLSRAKAIFEKIPLSLETVVDVNSFWLSFAHNEHDRGNYVVAAAAYRDLLDRMARYPSIYKDSRFNVFLTQRSLAMTLHLLGRYAESEALLVSAYTECVARNGSVSQQCLSIDSTYAFVLVGQQKFQEALPVQARRVANTASIEGVESVLYATALAEYGDTLQRAGGSDNLAKAGPMLREAFAIAKKVEVNTAVRRPIIGGMLMAYLRAQNRFDEALALANEVLEIVKLHAPVNSNIVMLAIIRVAQHEQLLSQHDAANVKLSALLPFVDKMSFVTKFNFHDIKLKSLIAANSPASDILAARRDALAAATSAWGATSHIAKRITADIEKLNVASIGR